MRLPDLASRQKLMLCAVLLSVLVPHGALAAPGVKPRMLIIFDTSKSMRWTPDELAQYPAQDYDPPSPGSLTPVCANANQGSSLTITCPGGQTVSSVDYAYYGKQLDNALSCGMGATPPNDNTNGCDLSQSVQQNGVYRGWRSFKAYAESQCVGKTSCTMTIDNTTLSDTGADLNPCRNVGKYGVVSVQCGPDPCPPGSGSKFCLGKRALYNVVAATQADVDYAVTGYFQQYWEKANPEVLGAFSTTCKYDAFAGDPNDSVNALWFNRNAPGNRGGASSDIWDAVNRSGQPTPAAPNVDTPIYSCNAEAMVSATDLTGGTAPVGLNGTCSMGQPAKQCVMRWNWVDTLQTTTGPNFTLNTLWSGARYQHPDPACQPNDPTTPASYTGACAPDLGDPETRFSGAAPTPMHTINVPAGAVGGDCNTAQAVFTDRINGTNKVYGVDVSNNCTAATPCAYYHSGIYDGNNANPWVTFYKDFGNPSGGPPTTIVIDGVTYNEKQTSGPSAAFNVGIANVPGATSTFCPASVAGYTNAAIAGCNTTFGGCDLTRSGSETPQVTYSCPSSSWTLSGTTCNVARNNRTADDLVGSVDTVSLTPGPVSWTGGFSYTIPLATYVANGRNCTNEGYFTITSNSYPGIAGYGNASVSCSTGTNPNSTPSKCKARFVSKEERSDLGVAICRFEVMNVNYTASTAGTPNYSCNYTRMTYQYRNYTQVCVYRAYTFQFQRRRYQYNFKLNAGDYWKINVTTTVAYNNQTTLPAGSEYCAAANSPQVKPFNDATGFDGVPIGQRCKAELAPGEGPCPPRAGRCKLHWGSAMNSRFANYLGSGTNGPADKLHTFSSSGPRSGCPVGDPNANDGVAPNAVGGYQTFWGDWCTSSSNGGYVPRTWQTPKLVADYYQPSQSNAPGSRGSWQGVYWDGVSSNPFNHSEKNFDKFYWVDELGAPIVGSGPLSFKTQGGSLFAPPQSVPPANWQYGLSAHRWGMASDPKLLFKAYNPVTNPRGLRMPDIGDMTPLTGALQNAFDYINWVRANPTANGGDSEYASCRNYSVLLVTDGLEEPFPSVTGTNPVGTITAMRNAGIDVYVVGFGVTGGLLDQMATAAGTAVNGSAYDASNYTTLVSVLHTIIGNLMTGYYVHSKPTLTFDGNRVYTGYFTHDGSPSMEYFGFLDAYSVASSTVSTAPIWKFSDKLNAMPTASRKLWARANWKTYLSAIDEMNDCASDNDAIVQTITGDNWCDGSKRAEANKVIYWVRNDRSGTKAGVFSDGAVKQSRLTAVDHSQPTAVAHPYFSDAWAAPAPGVPEAGNFDSVKFFQSYKAFKNNTAYKYASNNTIDLTTREATVFVQSNGGLLHAVREDETATTVGTLPAWAATERWAMAPRRAMERWKNLVQGEKYGLDGPMALSDVCFNEADCERLDGQRWLTILVGAAGRGGNYLYALDVTDPNKPVWLWDFNNNGGGSSQDKNMGEAVSGPVIARVKARGDSYKWGAFFGGGYSAANDSNCGDWDNAKGNFFYIVDVDPAQRSGMHADILDDHDKGDADHGKKDENAKYCIPGENSTVDGMGVGQPIPHNNVVMRPRVVRPNDSSRASLVYFGDTDGKVLRMNMTKDKAKDWKPKKWFNPFDASMSSCATTVMPLPDHPGPNKALPLAKPLNTVGLPQLTTRPILAVNDYGTSNGRTVVYLGSGNDRDPEALNVENYFWAIEDETGVSGEPCDGKAIWAYYLDKASGEKVLSEPTTIGNNIIVAVYVAPPALASGCGVAGYSKLYCFDRLSGTPKNCLNEATPSTVLPGTINDGANRCAGANCSVVEAGPGIVSDLVAVGNTVMFNSSVDPTPKQIAVSNTDQPFRVKSWRRVR